MLSKTTDGSACLPKKYTWYPNLQLESPCKTTPKNACSPGPKSVSSYLRFGAVRVRSDPMTPISQRGQNAVDSFAQVCHAVAKELKGPPSVLDDNRLLKKKCSLVVEESDF